MSSIPSGASNRFSTAVVQQHKPVAISAEPKGLLQLKKGDLAPLPKREMAFAMVGQNALKGKLKFNKNGPEALSPKASKERIKKHGTELKNHTEEKLQHTHGIALAIGQAGEPPSVSNFFKAVKHKIKDSAVGRFFQRNILHHIKKTQVSKMELDNKVDSESKKTALTFTLKAERTAEAIEANDPLHLTSDAIDHKIEVSFDRLRNQRAWYNPKRWIGNQNGRTGKVEDHLASLEADITRQVRLRNLGIGLDQEKGFSSEASGLLASLPETVGKKGVKAPALAAYSGKELHSLRSGLDALNQDKNALPGLDRKKSQALLDKAIAQKYKTNEKAALKKSEKLTNQELRDLRNLSLLIEIEKLGAIDNVAGDYAFTEKQSQDLLALKSSLAEAIGATTDKDKKSANTVLDKAIVDTSRSMREMSIMCWVGLEGGGNSYEDNLKQLLSAKQAGFLPESVILAPCLFSPQASRTQADNIQKYIDGTLKNRGHQLQGLENLEKQFEEAGHASSDNRVGEMREKLNARIAILKDRVESYRILADSSAGMYRFQGMLPILAKNNSEEITSFLNQQLGEALAESTGLQDDGNNYGKHVAGNALMAVGALDAVVRGNGVQGGAIAAAGAAVYAGGGPSENTTKYRDRLQLLSNAIMNGMIAGSDEQLIKSNRLLAEEKCEKTVQKWAEQHHGDLTSHSKSVGNLEEIKKSTIELEALVSNADGNRAELLGMIRTNIGSKLDAMGALKEEIEKTTKAIDKGPEGSVKVHDKLKLNQGEFEAQEAVKESLGKAGKQVEQECGGLITSFEILKAAYNPIDGRGAIHNSILEVEKKIAGEFSGDSKLKENGFEIIGTDVDKISSLISNQGKYLTNDHATHLHDLVGAVGRTVEQAAGVKATMQQVARGLASPNLDYMTGQLDKDVFEQSARFVEKGEFDRDLRDLQNAKAAVDVGGTNPYAVFQDAETRHAILNALDPLITDATASKKAWDNCLTTSTAMVVAAQEAKDIHALKEALTANSTTLRELAKELNKISYKYSLLVEQGEAFNFDSNIDSLHARSLREGTARLVGLPTPLDENCHKGLDALAGPLTDTKVHAAVARYLEGKENKAAAFSELFANLPEATDPKGWSDEQGGAWRKEVSKGNALNFICKLHALEEGGNPLSDALDLAQKLCDGDDLKGLKNDLYAPSIKASLEKAAKNEHLTKIFGELIDQNALMRTLAGKVDTLVDHGLEIDLKSKASSVGDIYVKFQDDTQRADLSVDDLEILLKFASVLGDLQENPEATMRHKVKLATLDLLANVNPDFTGSKDPKDALGEKLKAVFTPKPKDIGAWEQFKKKNNLVERNLKELQDHVQATEEQLKGAKGLFTKFRGSEALLNPGDQTIRSNRDNLLKAYQAYSSGNWAVRIDPKGLTNKGAVLNQKHLGQAIKSSGIDFDRLKYTKTATCEKDTKLEEFAQRIKDEQNAANLALNFRAGQNGIYQDFKPVSGDVADWISKHGKGPLDEQGADVLRRVFSRTDDTFLLDRLATLQKCISADASLKELSPKLTQAIEQHRASTKERDQLLGEHQGILFKNAVRAAILSHCSETGTDPATLVSNPHEEKIKNLLATWGWKENDFPSGSDISTYFEEAKHDGYLERWKTEAGSLRSDLSRIETAIDKALTTLQTSLLRLNSEINQAMEGKRVEMEKESKDISRTAASLLNSSKAHSENLLHREGIPSNKVIAATPLNELVTILESSHPSDKDKINNWQSDVLQKIGNNPNLSWKETSVLVSEQLTQLHDTLLGNNPDERPAYHANLTASRALEFDRSAYRFISELHHETAAKADAAIAEINRARGEFSLLTVANSLPLHLVTDAKGAPRTWVNQYAKISDNDPQVVAKDLNAMGPIKFLKKFDQGGDIHEFFASKNNPAEFQKLTLHMGKLRVGFESMEQSLESYDHKSYSEAQKLVAESFTGKGSYPADKIKGSGLNDPFTSIGKVLGDSAKPPTAMSEAWNSSKIDTAKVTIKSEAVYNRALTELDVALKAQEAEDQELDNISQEAGDEEGAGSEDEDFELIQNQVNDQMMAAASRYGTSRIGTLESLFSEVPAFSSNASGGGLTGSLTSQLFSDFHGTSEIQQRAHENWDQLKKTPSSLDEVRGVLPVIADYRHIPVEGAGYCSLTAMAAFHGMKTSELIAHLRSVATTPDEKQLVDEMLGIMSTQSSSFDPAKDEYQNLFGKAGLSFYILTETDTGNLTVASIIGNPPPEGSNAPGLLFTKQLGNREGHFDLLLPPGRNFESGLSLPDDGKKYVANDHRVHNRSL